jgi:hypothetical protein
MKAEAVGIDEKRLAALTLHALNVDDRGWMLDRVSASQRRELEALMSELVAIGIPSDPSLVDAALVPRSEPVVAAPAPSRSLTAEPHALARLLRSEPAGLAARCLSLLDAEKRAEVVRLLPEKQRVSIETAAVAMADAPELTAAIVRVVGLKLASGAQAEVRI